MPPVHSGSTQPNAKMHARENQENSLKISREIIRR